MLLTNLILLLALVVMVGIAIWLFRDGEGVGPTPYIRPFEDETAGDDGSRSGPASNQAANQPPDQSSNQSSNPAQNKAQTKIRVASDADTDHRPRDDS